MSRVQQPSRLISIFVQLKASPSYRLLTSIPKFVQLKALIAAKLHIASIAVITELYFLPS
ncbi:hypothetical protein MA16_Dca009770 [Dendrobium catenatum]|uniref:Uncharacterized protein n=1 Tax=Dendrobium catenatum TaxID=906689 RepID=A0A2I0VZ68_9ASPA|nr:hypothetical protein MA16_Dca009770 [Dendrobium catenatum]